MVNLFTKTSKLKISGKDSAFLLTEIKMKNLLNFALLILIFGCSQNIAEKPENLIKKDKMVDILYDLSILDAIKSQRPIYLEENGINSRTYIYKKYKIDSIQFAKSNQYYSSDFVEYKKIYDEVSKRLEESKKKNIIPNSKSDAAEIQ